MSKEKQIFSFGKSLPKSIGPFQKTLQKSSPPTWDKDSETNSYGCRSEEFISSHDGLHVLFTGCSVTYGDGLYVEETWPKLVSDKINENVKTSGYFNLAAPGTSISYATMMIYRYIEEFGKPDIIFFNMPTAGRFFSVEEDPKTRKIDVVISVDSPGSKMPEHSLALSSAIHFEMYHMLEKYCKESNIRLISFSWHQLEKNKVPRFATPLLFRSFDTFVDIFDAYSFDRYINHYVDKNLPELLIPQIWNEMKVPNLMARDHRHPGIIHQSFYANAALNLFDKDLYPEMNEFLKNT